MTTPNGHDKLDNRAVLTAKIVAALTAEPAALKLILGSCPHCKSGLRVGRMGGNTWGDRDLP